MDAAFDSLEWNSDLNWWSGAADFTPGHHIDLHVQAANDPAELRAAIERADPKWERLRSDEQSIRAAVADQMTDAHNDYCNPEDEVTKDQFAGRLRLKSVLFEADGSVELTYPDDGLFGGHWIVVPIGADGVVGEATEVG